ncbi:MAG: 50S ribosome-binding GTPase [Syntrophobacterales bacterium]|nr:50S ribosome-binding GTPase [Syntrophobacterales bacterium]
MADNPSEKIEKRLEEILKLIDELPEWVWSLKKKESLKERANRIKSEIFKLTGNVLTIGLIGGTGVGKSTLINALSGEEVSTVSHRRPHTNEIILYAHEETIIPKEVFDMELPIVTYRHRAERAKQILICDMPDFDSIKEEHHQLVRNFLYNLDLLIWVTSPEKYADEAFYEFLQQTVREKNPSNFYFVINKIDLIADEIEKLETLTSSFIHYLNQNGLEQPKLFLISAKDALEEKAIRIWNQWHLFKLEIFRERELKEIREIKSSNLLWELEQLERSLKEVTYLCASAAEHIRVLIQELSDFLPTWELEGKRISEGLITKNKTIKQILARSHDAGGQLKGTALIIFNISKMAPKPSEEESLLTINEVTKKPFLRLSERLNRLLLVRSSPESLIHELSKFYDPEELWIDWKERQSLLFEEEVERGEGIRSGIFGTIQTISYWGLVVIFVLSVGEFRYTERKSFFGWFGEGFLNFFEKIFAIEGLGALLSLITLEFIVGYLFFRFHRKSLQERAQKVIERLGKRTTELWSEVLLEIIDRLKSQEEIYISWAKKISEKKEVIT